MVDKKVTTKDNNNDLNIIGIGASAGGLKAIQEFFDNIPVTTGYAFVIVQHLSPDYKSLMGELLAKHTAMQVFEAEDNMQVTANCVYLIPSKKIMRIKAGRLKLEDKSKGAHPALSIDVFFESLAKERGSRAIGIILSGTGTDGTKGIEAIKSEGGVIIVQDPITAEFDGMPNSAINTGYADLILSPEMMGDELIEYINEAPLIKSFNELNKKDELLLRDILELVHSVTLNDFSRYKLPTISRRLMKRMMEKNIKSIEDYYRYLVNNEEEIRTLSKEFLINVTKFFRDAEAFEILAARVLPALFINKKDNETIKIWCVACSTGEEAYSLAMLCQEFLYNQKAYDISVKVFATDIDQDALNVASKAVYSKDALKDVSAERIKNFFVREGDNYTVSPLIRKMVIFAKHDITKDPPFGKIDLLSCRNMLIYMNPALQKKVLQSFHFSLIEGGYMFLGPSENLGAIKEYMQDVDKKWKIYKCAAKARVLHTDTYFAPLSKEGYTPFSVSKSKNALNSISDIFKETLLEEHKYAGIYIDKDLDVKQAIGSFRNFMNFPQGSFNFNLLKLVPTDLSIALGISIRKAMQTNERVVAKHVKVQEGKEIRFVNIIVKPYMVQKDYLQPFLFIVLEEELKEKTKREVAKQKSGVSESERVGQLEQELNDVRENLQAVIEEVESANEELQSSNEEIVSANEELQSTNEELQSLNEELHTVNAEHQLKIKEMIELNDDMNNYFHNSNIGQLLIDKKLIIRKFSPAATTQINLIENDIGRSITDISTNFKQLNFVNEIKAVINTGQPLEKEIVLNDEKSFLMRISPYVRQDRSQDGVVVNFIDISEITGLNEIVKAVFNSSPNGIIALKSIKSDKGAIIDFEIIAANNNAAEIMVRNGGELRGVQILKNPELQVNIFFHELVGVAENDEPFHAEYKNSINGNWYDIDAIRMKDGVVITFTDTTQKKHAATLLSGSNRQLQKAANDLQQINAKLEQSNYDLLQFASVASHDLKEPLRKIMVYGNLLKDKVGDNISSQQSKYLEKMITASNRMRILIDDVLTLSKLSKSEFSLTPVNLNEILNQILDDLDINIKEKNARIYVDGLTKINAVPGQMRQLFQNLIINSLKFNNKEQPVIVIKQKKLTKEQAQEMNIVAEEYISIDISDNGIGFDEQFGDKIFGLFQRLNGNIYDGTGIGLAICKKIVDNHKGFIRARSKPGDGAVFSVVLPVSLVVQLQEDAIQ